MHEAERNFRARHLGVVASQPLPAGPCVEGRDAPCILLGLRVARRGRAGQVRDLSLIVFHGMCSSEFFIRTTRPDPADQVHSP